MLLTHDHHADNLDDAGRRLLASVPVVVTTAAGAGRLGSTARGLEPWASTVLEGSSRPAIEVTATPCRHGPPLSRRLVGDVVGFALRWEGQQHGQLWISGDTVLYSGVRQVSRLQVSLAVLHLGGAHFPLTGPVRYTMTAADGVVLCDDLRPRTVVPVHYEGWSHFGDGRAEIERALAGAPTAGRRVVPVARDRRAGAAGGVRHPSGSTPLLDRFSANSQESLPRWAHARPRRRPEGARRRRRTMTA